MDKLRECPFCGGEAVIEEDLMEGTVFVGCRKDYNCVCSLWRMEDGYLNKYEAIKAWNTRHEPPTPGGAVVPAGNERLKK
jgi:hypothetical protein